MNGCAYKRVRVTDDLAYLDLITDGNGRSARSTDVLLHRKDNLSGSGHTDDCAFRRVLVVRNVNAAVALHHRLKYAFDFFVCHSFNSSLDLCRATTAAAI